MNFNDATLLTVSRKSQFLSDTVRYKTVKELTVEGLLLNLTNTDGVYDITSAYYNFSLNAGNWEDIIINGYNFGKGIIKTVDFSEGNDVRQKSYTVSIEIPEEGDLSTLINGGTQDYTGLSYTNFKYLENFSESSNFERNIGKDNYSQNIRFVLKGPYSLDAIAAAKTMAENFFNNNTLANTVGTKYSDSQIKKYYNESYDTVNNTYDFSRTYEINRGSNGIYSVTRTHSLNFSEQGVSEINESAEYINHLQVGGFDNISSQATTDLAGAYSRCNTIFAGYSNFIGGATLLTQPISKSWSATPFEGTIKYTVTFSNSSHINTTYFWDYQITKNTSEGGVINIEENGTIVGFGHILDTKYSNASSGWTNIKAGINSRLTSYYSGGTLKLISESLTQNTIEGKIDYSQKYTDADSNAANTQSIRKAIVKISIPKSNRYLSSTYNIINKKELLQTSPNKLPNTYEYSIELNGKATLGISEYLSAARSYIGSTYDYLSDVNYSYNPFQRSFSLNATATSLPA
jgi:hypothetical protein